MDFAAIRSMPAHSPLVETSAGGLEPGGRRGDRQVRAPGRERRAPWEGCAKWEVLSFFYLFVG